MAIGQREWSLGECIWGKWKKRVEASECVWESLRRRVIVVGEASELVFGSLRLGAVKVKSAGYK